MKTPVACLTIAAALAGCATLTPYTGPQRSDGLFGNIHPGMTEADVRQLAGTPDDTMYFPLSGNSSYGYVYYDTWGYMAEFSVTFGPDRLVQSKYSRRINDGGDHAGK